MEDLAAQIAKDEAEQKARAAEKRRLKEEEKAKRRESISCSASVTSSELSSDKQPSRRASAMHHMLHSTGASPMTTSGSVAHFGTSFNNGEANEGWDLLMVEESHSQVTNQHAHGKALPRPRPRASPVPVRT
jgi:sulfite reductase beta subunit-like hemoprotein